MSQLDPISNFAKVQASTGYTSGAVSIVLSTGQGSLLPQPSSAGAFNLVWWNVTDYSDPSLDPNVEIVRVTARSGDTLTITRAQEGTLASNKNTAGKTYVLIQAPTAKMISDINAALNGGFVKVEIPQGLVNGSNKTYTVNNTISIVLMLQQGNSIYAPAVGAVPNDFSYTGKTITMVQAAPIQMASSTFVVMYI